MAPSLAPTQPPTNAPSGAPTQPPSAAPSLSPTLAPSDAPTAAPTDIGKSYQLELFMYYNMDEELHNVIPSVFNEKLAYAVILGIKYGAYNQNKEEYKFLYASYICASFTVTSYDKNSPSWESMFDCDEAKDYAAEFNAGDNPDYQPETKNADYLSIIKVILTGDDEEDAADRIDALRDLLNKNATKTNVTAINGTATRRRLSVEGFDGFKQWTEGCMETGINIDSNMMMQELVDINEKAGLSEGSDDYETCEGYLGLDLDYFESFVCCAIYIIYYFLSNELNSINIIIMLCLSNI